MVNLLIREGRPAEIMLVEDNRGDALLAARAFEKSKIENNLTVASTGEQALSMLKRDGDYAHLRQPDIILLDLNLPGISGREVLAEIKGDPELRHIPVIILSSSAADSDVNRSYSGHASAYIVKPLSLEKFSEVVTSIEQFFFMLVVLPDSSAAE